jgi:hypothetical protein
MLISMMNSPSVSLIKDQRTATGGVRLKGGTPPSLPRPAPKARPAASFIRLPSREGRAAFQKIAKIRFLCSPDQRRGSWVQDASTHRQWAMGNCP